jgi:hypothetical protein
MVDAHWLFARASERSMPRIVRYLILVLIAMPATLLAAPSDPTGTPKPPSLRASS